MNLPIERIAGLASPSRLFASWRGFNWMIEDKCRSVRSRIAHDGAFRKKAALATAAALVVAGVGSYFAFRPIPKPDYLSADLDNVFEFTLLTDEFNALPVEERMRLMGELVSRLKGMSGQDSMLLAAFASGIAGSARQQIEGNVSRLAIDVWDKYAKDYGVVPEPEKEKYLSGAYVEFTKMMEALTGNPREMSDAERLSEGKRQAERDMKAIKNPKNQPDGESLGRVFGFVNNNMGGHANPQQRARGAQMMRDMARMFRGQDPSTGKPKGPG